MTHKGSCAFTAICRSLTCATMSDWLSLCAGVGIDGLNKSGKLDELKLKNGETDVNL